jgi:putative transposase
MPQSFSAIFLHIVFSTKNRAPFIDDAIAPPLYAYLGGVMESSGSLLCAGGMPDHVHLLVSLNRDVSASDIVRDIKSNSSKWIHETNPALRSFAWQSGYAAFSVSFSQLNVVRQYIERQAEHHRTRTFQQEFIELLQRHHLSYDERYVWD